MEIVPTCLELQVSYGWRATASKLSPRRFAFLFGNLFEEVKLDQMNFDNVDIDRIEEHPETLGNTTCILQGNIRICTGAEVGGA